MVSLPAAEMSTGPLPLVAGTDPDEAVKVAFGNCWRFIWRETKESRWVTLRPATESTLCRSVSAAVKVMPVTWYALESPLTVKVPLTVEVRATASCLEVSPTKSSLTRYPARDPVVTVHVPARLPVVAEVGVPMAAGLGVADSPSALGEERRPEKK